MNSGSAACCKSRFERYPRRPVRGGTDVAFARRERFLCESFGTTLPALQSLLAGLAVLIAGRAFGDVLIPSSAFSAGKNSAEFHSDVRVFNPTSSPVSFTPVFYRSDARRKRPEHGADARRHPRAAPAGRLRQRAAGPFRPVDRSVRSHSFRVGRHPHRLLEREQRERLRQRLDVGPVAPRASTRARP